MKRIVPRALSPRGFAALSGVVVLVVAGLAVTLGSAGHARLINLLDGHGWVANDQRGQVLLANGTTGRVDLKLQVKGAGGHRLEVIQAGRTAMLVDRSNGEIGTIDLNSFQVVNPANGGPPMGLDVEASPTSVYVINEIGGTVDARDPLSDRIIDSVMLGAPLSNGVVDSSGDLWIVNRHDGTLVSVAESGGRLHPTGHSVVVAPGAAVQMTLANGAPGVLDQSQGTFIRAPSGQASAPVNLRLDPGQTTVLANSVDGPVVPVAVNNAGSLRLITGASENAVTVPGRVGHDFGGPMAFGTRIYVPDYTAGDVGVLDDQGQVAAPSIPVRVGGGRFEVYPQNGALWINDPNGSASWSVDAGGGIHSIDKGIGDVPSNAPPQPTPPVAAPVFTSAPAVVPPVAAPVFTSGPASTPAAAVPSPAPAPLPAPAPAAAVAPATPVPVLPSPSTPTVPPSPPAAPGAVTALAANGQVSLSWAAADPHGSAITAYNVSWNGGNMTVAGGPSSQTVTGLKNGTTYTFTVSATNAYGTGPAATSNPVTPSSAVPATPTGVTATASPAGLVTVSWQPANGQGHQITGYTVFATDQTAGAGPRSVGTATSTSYTAPASALVAGDRYVFTISSTNDAGASSPLSSPSNPVTDFRPAGPPGGLKATGKGGQVDLTWSAPSDLGGGKLVDYQVAMQGRPMQPTASTSANFTGLSNGTAYTFTVAAETTADGQTVAGTAATATATPGTAPTISGLSAAATGQTSATVSFAVAANGGSTTCSIGLGGGPSWSGPCNGAVTHSFSSLKAGTAYAVTVTAKNSFGTSSAHTSVTTPKPPPQATVGHGVPYTGGGTSGSCVGPYCYWFSVTLQNFSPNTTYSVQCWSNFGSTGSFATFQMRTDGTGSAQNNGTNQNSCFFGNHGYQVWVVVTGGNVNVTSPRFTW